ncbi:MAG: toll/interleukin-1 receptor domain-containing protein [Propionicimonas sp.]|uniref:toll/interleukin-1 receptor domain-containing protein n=1 Tax=Propionicimonas sp. TaxID=1955623 RepID=UPI003D0C3A08
MFLSYRRADSQHVAGRAADKLADRYELFMDIDTIPPGVDFTEYLRRAIGGCDVLLAFIGERWATVTDADGRRRIDDPEDWVAAEITTALARNVPVIPVLVDGAVLPAAEALPESLRPLVSRQSTPLRFESFTADLAHLVAAIEHASHHDVPPGADAPAEFADRWDKDAAAPARTPAALSVPARRRSTLPVIVGVAVALACGVGGWLWFARTVPATVASPRPTVTATSTSATPLPPVPPATTTGALKARAPASFRGTCKRLVPTDAALANGLVVAVQCSPAAAGGGPRYAFYLQYGDAGAAQEAFRGYYAGSPAESGDCTQNPGEALDERSEGSPFGVLRCYRDANAYSVFAWIAPEQSIVASAADPDLSFGELFAWWSQAGPYAP